MRKRVVITGLGALTALGEGIAPLWEAVLQGRSGVDFLSFEKAFAGVSEAAGNSHRQHFNGSPMSGDKDWRPIGALIQEFNPEKFIIQRKALKVMARDIQLAVAGASLALEDAGIKGLDIPRDRLGLVVGSGVLNHELDELASSVKISMGDDGKLDLKRFGEEGIANLFPLWLLKYLPNMSACHISILFDLRGPNNTITTGSAGALQAVGEAIRIIERGAADIMLTGGAESKTNPVGLSQYQVLGALAELADDDPAGVYKPFDKNAGGLVVGEGAGFLVLEDLEHAKKRNAKIYAEILGVGSSSVNGEKIAMKAALNEASVSPQDLNYIQACGIGVAWQDLREAEAIQELMGGRAPGLLVSASKPVTGFTGFASGALDLVISTLALQNETVPPIKNFETPVHPWDFQIVKKTPLKKKMENAMTHAFGLNGQCTAVVTSVYQGR